MSPCTSDDDWSATFFAQTTPETLPRTTTCWPATIPVTLPCSPMMTSTAWTSPSISPSTCKVSAADDLKSLPHDLQIVADDRFVAAGRGAQLRLRPIRAVGARRAAFNCFGLECRVTLEHGIPQRCCWPHRCESCGQHMVELCRAELIQGLSLGVVDACGPHGARATLFL